MKTRTFRLNKLVRDKIVANHIESDGQVKTRRLSPKQKRPELLKKIIEEAKECLKSGEILEEIADIQEAIDQLITDAGLQKSQIKAEQAKKRSANGGFKHGDYIEHETWPASHKWAKYYAADPKRFPEVKSD